MAFSGKADQINESAFENSGTGFGFCCSFFKTPALPPNLIIQWTEIGCVGATRR